MDTILPPMEVRNITFDPGPHTYTDEYQEPYISVTTLVGTVVPKYDAEFWAVYRVIDQMQSYKPRPFYETREIEIRWNKSRQKFSIEFLQSGIIPTISTPELVRNEWKDITEESCEWGTERHEYLEDCVNKFSKSTGIKFHDISTVGSSRGFAFKVTNLAELAASPLQYTYPAIYSKIEKLIKDGWVAYAEKRVYSSYHRVAGTIDLLFVRGKDVIVFDWKTNKDPLKFIPGYYKKEWNSDRTKKYRTGEWVTKSDRLLYPLDTVPYAKGMLYTLQLSLYAFICEMWGFNPVGIVLCHIRPKLDANKEIIYTEIDGQKSRVEEAPEFYKIDYLRAEVSTLLHHHITKHSKS